MGVATAIAIAAGVSAASSMASSKMAANASKKAAATQAASAKDAQGMAGNMFQQQQQMQSPYMQLGQNSAMTLGRLMGSPGGARFATPPMDGGGFGQMQGGMAGPQPMRQVPGLPPPPGPPNPLAPLPPQMGSRPGPMPPQGPPQYGPPSQFGGRPGQPQHLSQFGGY